ncbi:MAG: hypothetical protein IKB82_01150 [Clostridia bacterium]|nr:hypothetical protein [Clostridia bacterium]
MFAIIVNPVSGRANEALTAQLIASIEQAGHSARIFLTECEGDATAKTRMALEAG